MISIQSLTKTYKGNIQALRGIDLNIDGGMFGLLGPNGAGKTTLMRIVAGLLQPTSGQVTVLGHDIRQPAGRKAVKQVLGYLPQELGLYPNLTGREFLSYIGTLKGIHDPHQRSMQVDELLTLMRLTDAASRPLKTYSGGMKRRIGIAQALLGQPRLVIVDEPTVGLDPEERVRIRNLLGELAQRCTVILSTHVIEDISHSCRHLAIIDGGRVLYQGTPVSLAQEARGHVWSIRTAGEHPAGDVTVVSTLQLENGVQYRVLGAAAGDADAQPVEAGLEDGYMWVMRQSRTAQ